MCCCGKPVINGELGYKWQPNDAPMVRQPDLPDMQDGDVLLYDEPGRCGGLDCHHLDLRVVKRATFGTYLLFRHGGGQGRIKIFRTILPALAALDSNGRYWVLHEIYNVNSNAGHYATNVEGDRWRTAAAEKRIKTQKQRGKNAVKVWIEEKVVVQ